MVSLVLKTFSFIFIFSVAALLVSDTNKYGSFRDSSVSQFLRYSGAHKPFMNFRHYCQMAYRWSQKNVPLYMSRAREILITLLLVIGDLIVSLAQHLWTNLKIVYHYIVEKKPLALKWIDQHAPGLTEKIAAWFLSAREYTAHLVSLLVTYVKFIIQWLIEHVFTGTPPESLKRHNKHSDHHSGYRHSSNVLDEGEDDYGHF